MKCRRTGERNVVSSSYPWVVSNGKKSKQIAAQSLVKANRSGQDVQV